MNNEQYHYEREINRQGKLDEIPAKEITINYLKKLEKEKIEQLKNVAGDNYMEFVISMDINAINDVMEMVEEREEEQ